MTKNALIKKIRTEFPSWTWFTVLTFEWHRAPSTFDTNQLFYAWIEEVEQEDGTDDFQWCRVINVEDALERDCFYLLVRGLRAGRRHDWKARWEDLTGGAGFASIFDAYRHGDTAKLLKDHLSPHGEFQLQSCLRSADVKWDR